MSEPHVASRMQTQRRELGRLTPRRFTQTARWRFNQDRRRCYLLRVGGAPDERQAGIIEGLIATEWQALRLEAEAERTDAGKERYDRLRLAAEYRRQLMLLDRDLAQTTRKPASPAKAKRPGPSQIDLDQHMARLRERREGAA